MATQAPEYPGTLDIVAALPTMELDAIRETWRKHFAEPPPLRSVDTMRLMLGWRLQARTHGGIDKATRQKLKRRGTIAAEGLHLGAGTKLLREWQGQIYEILVEEEGFRWDGKVYASLSAVAMAITGTRWNGPRFFGLRDDK